MPANSVIYRIGRQQSLHKSRSNSIASSVNLSIKLTCFYASLHSFQNAEQFSAIGNFNAVLSFCQFQNTCAITNLQTHTPSVSNKPPLFDTLYCFNSCAFASDFVDDITQFDWSVCASFCCSDLPPPCRTKVMEQSPLISENSGYETIQIYR